MFIKSSKQDSSWKIWSKPESFQFMHTGTSALSNVSTVPLCVLLWLHLRLEPLDNHKDLDIRSLSKRDLRIIKSCPYIKLSNEDVLRLLVSGRLRHNTRISPLPLNFFSIDFVKRVK